MGPDFSAEALGGRADVAFPVSAQLPVQPAKGMCRHLSGCPLRHAAPSFKLRAVVPLPGGFTPWPWFASLGSSSRMELDFWNIYEFPAFLLAVVSLPSNNWGPVQVLISQSLFLGIFEGEIMSFLWVSGYVKPDACRAPTRVHSAPSLPPRLLSSKSEIQFLSIRPPARSARSPSLVTAVSGVSESSQVMCMEGYRMVLFLNFFDF